LFNIKYIFHTKCTHLLNKSHKRCTTCTVDRVAACKECTQTFVYSLEDSDEEVEQQNVGEQQIDTQHDDGQPFGEHRQAIVVHLGAFGLQRVRGFQTAAALIKLGYWFANRDIQYVSY